MEHKDSVEIIKAIDELNNNMGNGLEEIITYLKGIEDKLDHIKKDVDDISRK